MKTTISEVLILEIPKVSDPRGNLAVIEKETIPFSFKRVYYLYDVPSDAYRGGHAHIQQQEFLVALSGSFDVILDDGNERIQITLNKPDKGLLIPVGIWRELDGFSSGSVCLVLASEEYDENDYIRDYSNFKLFKRS
ncbi:WxcM-like domain-containing protein [Bizionia argentinensis JUB59]|uniref:WxcM-like domain-containing protein n=1 Tax=Bizionia argentinensis JUB59 TaxID=1046627 RepID=G2EG73_9FLAO|nr:FdtA/QdtA family cupin domain-containing protein [Bizionia argentinensis]EGV42603.1 WxcM-like domain-containing protein [Bizionia argentinensis JUB59]